MSSSGIGYWWFNTAEKEGQQGMDNRNVCPPTDENIPQQIEGHRSVVFYSSLACILIYMSTAILVVTQEIIPEYLRGSF